MPETSPMIALTMPNAVLADDHRIQLLAVLHQIFDHVPIPSHISAKGYPHCDIRTHGHSLMLCDMEDHISYTHLYSAGSFLGSLYQAQNMSRSTGTFTREYITQHDY